MFDARERGVLQERGAGDNDKWWHGGQLLYMIQPRLDRESVRCASANVAVVQRFQRRLRPRRSAIDCIRNE